MNMPVIGKSENGLQRFRVEGKVQQGKTVFGEQAYVWAVDADDACERFVDRYGPVHGHYPHARLCPDEN